MRIANTAGVAAINGIGNGGESGSGNGVMA